MKSRLIAGVVLLSMATGCMPTDLPPASAASSAAGIRHVDAGGAAELVAGGDLVILDLRTSKEYADGRIPGAMNIDFYASDFAERVARLDRAKVYLVHCASGGRSTRALEVFTELGFKSVAHLDGGITAWRSAGEPIEK